MELGKTEAKFFGVPNLPLIEEIRITRAAVAPGRASTARTPKGRWKRSGRD